MMHGLARHLDRNRFDTGGGVETMKAVVTTGNGGYERLEYRDVPIPTCGAGEALLRVLAAGVNNTEINTRLGWYGAAVTEGTNTLAAGDADHAADRPDGGWSDPTPFPFIQGTDCCGIVVKVGSGVPPELEGRRALVRACMRPNGFGDKKSVWMGSDFDGAFAQFVCVPAGEVFPVACDLTDVELAAIPCAYGTAENLLDHAGVRSGDHVLVTGASGGVGSATVQLACRRDAVVHAIAGQAKHDRVRQIGARHLIPREQPVAQHLGDRSMDVVVDVVGGPGFSELLSVLRRGGIYVTSGAIGGPLVELDLRSLYLWDITMVGTTAWEEPVFPNLVKYVERGEIKPLVARTFPLSEIVAAQQEFMLKDHVGKFVLVPPCTEG